MTEPIQATQWTAQMTDKSIIRGGQGDWYAGADISTVDTSKLLMFQVVHNTFTDKYYKPRDTWYHSDQLVANAAFTPEYPMQYTMKTGALLTIDKDATTGLLTLTEF